MADKKLIDIDRLSRYHENLNTFLATKQDVLNDIDAIRSGASKGETALQSYTEQYKGTIEAVSTTETIDDVSNDFVTSEQLNARGYATENFVTTKIAEASISGGSDVNLTNYYTKDEIDDKGYLTEHQSLSHLATKAELSGYTTDAEYNSLVNTVNGKQEIISDLATIRANATKGATALQSVPAEYVTETELTAKNFATTSSVDAKITPIENLVSENNTRMDRLENYVEPSVRSSILWLGTSIPSGDQVNQPDNNYPKMVGDAIGCKVYNNARAGSIVSWYPAAPTHWTTSAHVDAEFATGYCLSATKAELRTKYYDVLENIRRNEGLSTTWRDNWLEDFYDKSYENLIIPYIDGTIAACDTVIIDHGFNDRSNIFDVCSQHPHAEDNISYWPADQVGGATVEYPVTGGNTGWFWLNHLADNRYYDGEVYMNTLRALGAAGDGGMRGEYFGAIAYLIEVIRKVNPRIRIIIGNYFSLDHGFDAMSSFVTKYILQANQSIADYYGFRCVNVYKTTGLRNYSFTDNAGVTATDMYRFCPDGVHPHSDTTGLSNKIIAGAYLNELRGTLYI